MPTFDNNGRLNFKAPIEYCIQLHAEQYQYVFQSIAAVCIEKTATQEPE